MDHAHLGNYGPLQRLLLALVLAVTWCSVSMAANGWHKHDQVTISGTPGPSVTAGQTYSFTPVRDGLRRPHTRFRDCQHAIVGNIQHQQRPAVRYAVHHQRRHVLQHRDRGQ